MNNIKCRRERKRRELTGNRLFEGAVRSMAICQFIDSAVRTASSHSSPLYCPLQFFFPFYLFRQSLITAIQDGLLKFSHLQPISDPLHRLVQPEYRIDCIFGQWFSLSLFFCLSVCVFCRVHYYHHYLALSVTSGGTSRLN